MTKKPENLSIVIVGASGDLSTKKILPALFALYCQGFLPEDFRIFGFARTPLSNDEFRSRITEHLTCRYAPSESCADRTNEFLTHCFYSPGKYESRESFLDLYQFMQETEKSQATNRIFYLAIPPSIFLDTARAMAGAGLVICEPGSYWSRVVIEKPFGKDRESSDILTRGLAEVFSEEQTYRIDHYLGKEIIQNLMVLRFANLVFEPIWNRSFIKRIHIDWKENIGVENRGGYFDEYGIVRDVIQNHLLQILALIAMEKPVTVSSRHIRDEKVRVLKSISPVTLDEMVLGQYTEGITNNISNVAYTREQAIPADSATPTCAAVILHVNNKRWNGVPFSITAGKGLDSRSSEVRIQFRELPENIFCNVPQCLPANDLIIRIQPDESIFLNIINKKPGLDLSLVETNLNLRYQSTFSGKIPDAYERLILDVIEGDKGLFIRSDELAAAWDIFTPVLHKIDRLKIKPELYPFGSSGPSSIQKLLTKDD
ncbi:MAG: glucose-6-phosphate dehydrogenase [Kiritimatiellae bacterium]|nr:glucose-6-phosphate dehydrogenase [Kiritimatiellia bacterium]MDD5520545.1 glucose-6-phosphate dehydrogenase [Kiritimatiellia bacterium]